MHGATAMLYAHLRQSAHLVRFAPPVIEPAPGALRTARFRWPNSPPCWKTETQRRWTIALSQEPGAPTIEQAEQTADAEARQTAAQHPLLAAILAAFPGARIESAAPPATDAETAGRLGRVDPPRRTLRRRTRFMKNLTGLMKQAQQMQQKMQDMQAKLDAPKSKVSPAPVWCV